MLRNVGLKKYEDFEEKKRKGCVNGSRLIHDTSIAYLIECIVPILSGFTQQTVVLYSSVLSNLWMRYYYAIRIQAPPVQSSVLCQWNASDFSMNSAWMWSLWWPWTPRKEDLFSWISFARLGIPLHVTRTPNNQFTSLKNKPNCAKAVTARVR